LVVHLPIGEAATWKEAPMTTDATPGHTASSLFVFDDDKPVATTLTIPQAAGRLNFAHLTIESFCSQLFMSRPGRPRETRLGHRSIDQCLFAFGSERMKYPDPFLSPAFLSLPVGFANLFRESESSKIAKRL
jgi:hypothetical protein